MHVVGDGSVGTSKHLFRQWEKGIVKWKGTASWCCCVTFINVGLDRDTQAGLPTELDASSVLIQIWRYCVDSFCIHWSFWTNGQTNPSSSNPPLFEIICFSVTLIHILIYCPFYNNIRIKHLSPLLTNLKHKQDNAIICWLLASNNVAILCQVSGFLTGVEM